MTNASLLDESTAAAEAVTMACRATKRNKVFRVCIVWFWRICTSQVLIDPFLHAQNIDLINTRCE